MRFSATTCAISAGTSLEVQVIAADVLDPTVSSANGRSTLQDERGLVVGGAEDQRLRAVDSSPAVIAGEVVEMLRRDDDGAIEVGAASARRARSNSRCSASGNAA
jgi:hypothetical protein